jgi:hypothetical protein
MGIIYALFGLSIACFVIALVAWHNLLDVAKVEVVRGFFLLGLSAVICLEVRIFNSLRRNTHYFRYSYACLDW